MKKFTLFAYCVTLMFILGQKSSFAESLNLEGKNKLNFEENKNQWPAQVLFSSDLTNGKVFFEKNTFTYVFHESLEHHYDAGLAGSELVKHHAFKVNFLNANNQVQVSGLNAFPQYRNYYRGNDPSKWAEGVRVFGEVSYQSIYPQIDLKVYSKEDGNMKYDFILQPGANHNWIKLKYEGANHLKINNGNLEVQTAVGDIIEQKPYAYQIINGAEVQVSCAYILDDNNVLGFQIFSDYDRDQPLIIDPTLIVSTFTGSTANNFGFTATYDAAGNIYTGGIAYGAGYPTTVGAYNLTFNGVVDISLTKFNATGTALVYSTYYGGSNSEQPHSIIVNNSNELFVTGRTNSTDFPVLGAYQSSSGGGYDIILGKFNAAGGLSASTYVGGAGDDGVNYSTGLMGNTKFNYADDGRGEIMLDNAGNVLVSMCTQSANFPTVSAYDATLGGAQDACIFKMNNALSTMSWSTYLGGALYDAGFGIKVDASNNVYVTGGTTSADFPTSAGVLNTTFQGGPADGFVTIFNSAGVFQRSTYIGTADYDQSFFIELDASNNVYVMGQTMGAYPVTAGKYFNANGRQFIHKMNNALNTTIFSTVFGTGGANPDISPTAFLVDSCQNLYVSGWGRCAGFGMSFTGTTIGLPITANAYQSTTDGCDFYFLVLTADAKKIWYGTFFGRNGGTGDHVDGGTSRFDRRGVIYQSVCAGCSFSSAFPTTAGAYSTVNGNSCNNAVVKMDVSIKPLAIANLVPPGIGCAPFTIPFNTTGSTASHYLWNFGDGSPTDTVRNISHTYTTAGTFTVTLYAMDSLGICVIIDSSKLVVTVGLPPNLVMTKTDVTCFGGTNGSATVTATAGLSPYTYAWTPTPQTTLSATGLSAGTYSVVVRDNIGCSNTGSITITQPPLLTAGFNSGNVCLGNATTFVNQSSAGAVSWNWNFGNGNTSTQQNPTITYTAANTYTVNLVVTSASTCTASITNTVVVNPQPVASFSATTVCLGNPTSFSNLSTGGGTNWSWNFGDGNSSTQQNPSNTYTAAGTYTATLISTANPGGCNSSISKIITVNPQPIASFSASTVCLGNPTQFSDLSTGGGTSWNWNFGDGNSSSQQSPSHTYSLSGTYSVTLNTSASGGCNDIITLVVTVNPQPQAVFSVNTVCLGLPTQFTNTTTGGATQWSWNFGDGGTSTSQNPSNTYTAAGTYSTTLVATAMPGGCNSTFLQVATVLPVAQANFNTADICLNTNPAQFSDLSIGAAQWLWNFGDGTPTSTQQNPSHIFGAPGTYSVTLLVQSSGACLDSITQIINVNPVPDAIFISNIVCFNNPTQFTDQSLGIPTQWSWNFGDGNTSNSQSPSHTYGAPGTYTVTLIATNTLGCSDTLPLVAVVNPLPSANFIAPTVCIGSTTCFKDTTLLSSGVIATWSWNFGDPTSGTNNISNLQNPCHTYTAVGVYNVVLTATSNDGCQSTINLPVSVTLPPVASFTATSVCMNTATTFSNLSTGSIQWSWNFGDGGTSTLQSPTHVYLGYGNYVVTLIASSGGLCADTIIDTITINPTPVVVFSADTVCVGKPTAFTDASFIPSGNIISWIWNFGDPTSGANNSSLLQHPTHIFSAAGSYSVSLTTTSAIGCVSSNVISVIVYPGPNADFTFTPSSPINISDLVYFNDQSTGSPVQWWWNFGDNDTSITQNPSHLYSDIGTYTITLIAVTQNGCADTTYHPLEILQFAFYIPNAFTPGIDGKNDFFFGKGVGIVEYELIIFDRWGNQIFFCKVKDLPQTPPCMWDGKVEAGTSNERAQEDVYVWKVELLDIFGDSHSYIGTVTIVK